MGPMYDGAACRWTGGGRDTLFSLKEASLSLASLLFLIVFDRIDECHLFFTALSVLSGIQWGYSRSVVRAQKRGELVPADSPSGQHFCYFCPLVS